MNVDYRRPHLFSQQSRLSSRAVRGQWLRLTSLGIALSLLVAPVLAQGSGWSLPSLQGNRTLTEKNLSQGATIIVLWASWSPRCRNIVDRVNALEGRWGQVAEVVTVDFQEDRSEVQGFLSGKKLAVPVYLDADGLFSKKYALTTLPGLLVFRDGEVVYRGKLPNDPNGVISDAIG